MRHAGLLETMASNDLEVITRAVGRSYRSGSVERLLAHDPAWREAVERAERVALYAELCAADGTLLRWREAVAGALPRMVARQRRTDREHRAELDQERLCSRRSRSRRGIRERRAGQR